MKKIILLLLLVSCDLLTTRDPEKPDKPRANFITPSSPEVVFQNLTNSFNDKVSENYIACFIDKSFLNSEFSFVSSAGSNTQFPILLSWDIFAEKQYFTNLISQVDKNSKINLLLSNEEKQIYPDSIVIKYNYSLSVPTTNSTNNYQGVSLFTLRIDSRNFWVITKWVDIKLENFLSWSELKGNYY